jgi:ATP-dependent phosphoenolpyruvate carboxykinase
MNPLAIEIYSDLICLWCYIGRRRLHTMLIRPTKQQLADFGKPDFVIYNAGAFPANSLTAGMGSKTSVEGLKTTSW